MSNLNALNSFLKTIDSAGPLIAEYEKRCPDVLKEARFGGETERDALNYCSGAAEFVAHFLTGNGAMHDKLIADSNQKALTAKTAAGLLAQVKGSGALRIGYLVHTGGLSHNCIFAGAGNQWGFYQANINGGSREKHFTLVPQLNPLGKNWCLNDMDERRFEEFFMSVVGSGPLRLFADPMTAWKIAAYSSTGQNLLA
jgi:hypothetical protein